MKDRSPWDILIAEMSYFLTVMLALAAGYYFWKINLLPKFTDESPHGLLYSIPFLVLFELAMVIVFLFTLRRVLLKSRILTKEESFKYLWSRSWYVDK
jgi:hypothetical protein